MSSTIILQIDRNLIPTCLYTELAKCYFSLGLFMPEENTDDDWLTHEPEHYPLGEEEE